MQKLLSPKNDYVFKRIFGSKGNEEITKDLLNSILTTKISKIELDCNPILETDIFDEKIGILDVKAKLDDNTNCDIEMQIIDRKNIEKRILYYWSKMYSKSLRRGENYDRLEKSIVVAFVDYEIENLKDITKPLSKWNVREEEFSKKVLTNDLELYIIEMPKFKKYKKTDENLNKWVNFIESLEGVNMEIEDSKALEEARRILEDLSQSEHDRYVAELREKYIMDQKAIEDAGYDKGLKVGEKRGIEIGKEQGLVERRKERRKDRKKERKRKNSKKIIRDKFTDRTN